MVTIVATPRRNVAISAGARAPVTAGVSRPFGGVEVPEQRDLVAIAIDPAQNGAAVSAPYPTIR